MLDRFVDARYRGQVHELITPVPSGRLGSGAFEVIAETFHELHTERYGWSRHDYPIEYVHWRVTARGVFPHADETPFDVNASATSMPANEGRNAYFPEYGEYRWIPVYRASEVRVGACVKGPAFIDSEITTIVVYPGHRLVADGRGNFVMEILPLERD